MTPKKIAALLFLSAALLSSCATIEIYVIDSQCVEIDIEQDRTTTRTDAKAPLMGL